jgi:uracil-DNA glycosylase
MDGWQTTRLMSALFTETLAAVIQHVEHLKAQGIRYLPVSASILTELSAPPVRRTRPAPLRETPVVVAALSGQPDDAVSLAAPLPEIISESEKEAKAVAMTALRERALLCQKCPHLVRSRKNVVFGVGDIHAPLMFVGEAPGADEDEQGEPFVGKAGQLLTRIIHAMGYSRETVYIANILKCRPDTPNESSGNRRPTADEIKTCLPYLLAQVDLIKPKVLVALGATAMEGLFGKPVSISRIRGQFQQFRDIPLMPTYHPSYLLRNQGLSVKREVWEDMLQVMEFLKVQISEKQRSYFLKAS